MNRSAARICQAMCWFCLGSPEDVMKSNPTPPTRRLQVRMEPLLDQVNVWSLSVSRLYEKVQNPEWLRTGWLMPQCNVFSRGEPGKLARAHLSESLSLGTTPERNGKHTGHGRGASSTSIRRGGSGTTAGFMSNRSASPAGQIARLSGPG
jgi:hypothetical protein